MYTANQNHKSTSKLTIIALAAVASGFGFGILGAQIAVGSVARAEAKVVADVAAPQKLSFPAPIVVTATVKKQPAPVKVTPTAVKSAKVAPTTTKTSKVVPKAKNTLVVPRMGVNSAILEGNVKTLNQGIWHVPGSSNPVKGGNMVISAHRYKWLPPSTKTFWDIDKMKVGDPITITWEGKTYTYKVAKTYIVTPDRVDIMANTKKPRLTLFSCTPKFTSKNRLVVEAYPVETVATSGAQVQ